MDRQVLRPGEAHLWFVSLDSAAGDGADLTPAERERARGYDSPVDGARFAAGRAAARAIARGYHDDAGGLPRPHVSLSRSGGRALVAVALAPVGADLELHADRPGLADLAAARFGPREAHRIAAGCCGLPLAGFYLHWCAREAYLKATGSGLAAGLRGLGVTCGPEGALWRDGAREGGWALSFVSDLPGHAAAVVTQGATAPAWSRREWPGY